LEIDIMLHLFSNVIILSIEENLQQFQINLNRTWFLSYLTRKIFRKW